MKLKEVIFILSNKLNVPVNQTMLANSLGLTRQTISNRIKNDSEVTVTELNTIETYFNVKLLDSNSIGNSGDILVDYYPDVFASCGNGTILFSNEKELLYIPKALFSNYSSSKKYSMINAKGDSMTPYINEKDKILIEHSYGEQIIDNKVYAFCYKQDFFIKRLAKNVDEIIVKSENIVYNTKFIKNEDLNDLQIIGKVVGIIRNI